MLKEISMIKGKLAAVGNTVIFKVYNCLYNPVAMLEADFHHSDLLSLRHHWMGGESQRCWLLVWEWRGGPVQRCQWHPHDLSSTPAGHGGLQVALQWDRAHRVVSTQLLLQVGRCTKRSLFEWTSCQHLHGEVSKSHLQTLLQRWIILWSVSVISVVHLVIDMLKNSGCSLRS